MYGSFFLVRFFQSTSTFLEKVLPKALGDTAGFAPRVETNRYISKKLN